MDEVLWTKNTHTPFVCLRVAGWDPGSWVDRVRALWVCLSWAFSSEQTEVVAEQCGGGSNTVYSGFSINSPKWTFRMCSFLAFRKGFYWLPGSREQGCGRVIIWEQPGISSAALENWGGAERDRFFFRL